MKVAKSKSNEIGFCNGISALIGGWSLNRYEHICNKLLIFIDGHQYNIRKDSFQPLFIELLVFSVRDGLKNFKVLIFWIFK